MHTHTYTLHTGGSVEGFVLKLAGLLDPKKTNLSYFLLNFLHYKSNISNFPNHSGSHQSSEAKTQVTCDVTDPVCVQCKSLFHLLFFLVFIFSNQTV